MAIVIGVNNFLAVVNDKMGSPLSVTIVRSFVATIIFGVILILMALLKPFKARDESWRPWPAWLRYTAIALGLFTIAAALLGYIGLALFVSLQVVVTGTVLITAYIGFLSARAIGEEGGFADTSVGRWLSTNSSYEETALDQLGLVVSIAINLMIVLVFLPLILLMWGFQPGDIQAWAYKLATGITIGSVTILGPWHPHRHRRFRHRLLPDALVPGLARRLGDGARPGRHRRAQLDPAAVGYAGVALAALVGVSAAGIDLSNLALVAGALSLGIGFGLQNVVSNFVSGLILLAERPFKVGDWIVAGEISGTVKKISVRATEIETFQRQSVILPNSNLINNAVGNWTHRNKLGRVEIKVGVAYGSDVKRAHADPARHRAQPSAGTEEPGALRAVHQFRRGGARIRDPGVSRRRAERQHRAERHPLRGARCFRQRAHRDPLDAARRGQEAPRHGRSTTTRSRPSSPSARRRKLQQRSRGNAWQSQSARAASPTRIRPIDPVREPAFACHQTNCGMNAAFSCGSACKSYKLACKGRECLAKCNQRRC